MKTNTDKTKHNAEKRAAIINAKNEIAALEALLHNAHERLKSLEEKPKTSAQAVWLDR